MKIRYKLWSAFAALSLLLVFLGVISINSNRLIVKSFEGGEEHFRSIVESAIHVSNEAKQAESLLLSFLMVGNQPDRSDYLKVEESLRYRLAYLKQSVEIPAAKTILVELNAASQRLFSAAAFLLDRYDQATEGGEKFNLQKYASQLKAFDDASAAVREGGIKLGRIETDFLNRQAAITAATEVTSYARRAHGHLFMYLILGDKADRDKFYQRHASLQEQIAILNERTTSPDGMHIVDDLKFGANELLAAGNLLLRAYDQEIRLGNPWNANGYQDLVQSFTGSVDRVANSGLKITDLNVALEMQPKEIATGTANYLQIAVIVFTAISVILSLVLAFLIARSIAKPVAQLNVAAGEIATGKLDVMVDVKSKDEIGQLGISFNTMAVALRNSKTDLLAAKDYTEQVIRSMDDALVVVGTDNLIQSLNPSASRLLGYNDLSLVGQSITSIVGEGVKVSLENGARDTQPDPKIALVSLIHKASTEATRFVITLPGDTPLDLAIAAFPINLGSGHISIGLLMRDVTRERDLERRRYQFISNASHELRTPMTAILGFSELLLHRNPSEETRKYWLEHLHRESLRLTSLVNNILNVFSVQSGTQKVDIKCIRLEDPVEEALSCVRNTTGKHEFMVDIAPNLPGVMADREKVVQVLTNILDNAIKFSPDGGKINISVYNEPMRKRAVVAISDQGIGISTRESEVIFTAFSRIYRPETGNIRGTGLGLFTVKGWMDLMRGEVWMQSEKGKGSTFFVALQTEDNV